MGCIPWAEAVDLSRVLKTFDNGDVLIEHPVAKPGNYWHPSYGHFTLDDQTFQEWESNMQAMVDRGHEVAFTIGHPAEPDREPAAAWMTGLKLKNGLPHAVIRVLKKTADLIREGVYKWFSPEFEEPFFMETAEDRGSAITGGAITNTPFLVGLPPLALAAGNDLKETLASYPGASLLRLQDGDSKRRVRLSGRFWPGGTMDPLKKLLAKLGADTPEKAIEVIDELQSKGLGRFHDRIRSLMEEKGMSAKDVAAAMSGEGARDASTINQIAAGDIDVPPPEVVSALAGALGVSVESLQELLPAPAVDDAEMARLRKENDDMKKQLAAKDSNGNDEMKAEVKKLRKVAEDAKQEAANAKAEATKANDAMRFSKVVALVDEGLADGRLDKKQIPDDCGFDRDDQKKTLSWFDGHKLFKGDIEALEYHLATVSPRTDLGRQPGGSRPGSTDDPEVEFNKTVAEVRKEDPKLTTDEAYRLARKKRPDLVQLLAPVGDG